MSEFSWSWMRHGLSGALPMLCPKTNIHDTTVAARHSGFVQKVSCFLPIFIWHRVYFRAHCKRRELACSGHEWNHWAHVECFARVGLSDPTSDTVETFGAVVLYRAVCQQAVCLCNEPSSILLATGWHRDCFDMVVLRHSRQRLDDFVLFLSEILRVKLPIK